MVGVLRLSRSSLSQNSRSTDAMGRPKKPIQRRSDGVYCVQLHLDGKRVMHSLETKDIDEMHSEMLANRLTSELASWIDFNRYKDIRLIIDSMRSDPERHWIKNTEEYVSCLLYTSPSPRDGLLSRMPSSA